MIRVIFIFLLCLTSCQTEQDRIYAKLSKDDKKVKEYKGHYKLGQKTEPKNVEIGMASWYGTKHLFKKSFHGQKTANGDKFNTDALTGAHRTLPIPSIVKVTNLANNKSILIMINDRGPYHKNRVLDVSSKVASILDFKLKGIAKVKIEPMEKETADLLDKLSLSPKHGSKPKGKIKDPKCSVNCFVKLMNMKHNFKVD
jgi:rare lipoprotein A